MENHPRFFLQIVQNMAFLYWFLSYAILFVQRSFDEQ